MITLAPHDRRFSFSVISTLRGKALTHKTPLIFIKSEKSSPNIIIGQLVVRGGFHERLPHATLRSDLGDRPAPDALMMSRAARGIKPFCMRFEGQEAPRDSYVAEPDEAEIHDSEPQKQDALMAIQKRQEEEKDIR